MQDHGTSCKLIVELHASSANCMEAQGTAYKLREWHASKLRELHASLCNCMQTYVTACKLM